MMANKNDVVIVVQVLFAEKRVYMSQADVGCWLLVIGSGFFTTTMTIIMNVYIQNTKLDFIILYFHKLFITKMTEYLCE